MDQADLNEVRRVVLNDQGTLPLPSLCNGNTIQRADPRDLRTESSLSRHYRAVQFVMRWLLVGRRTPDGLKGTINGGV